MHTFFNVLVDLLLFQGLGMELDHLGYRLRVFRGFGRGFAFLVKELAHEQLDSLVAFLLVLSFVFVSLGRLLGRLGCLFGLFGEEIDVGRLGARLRLVIGQAEHLLVVQQNFGWQAFEDPLVLKGLQRAHSGPRVPVDALVDKGEKLVVAARSHALESLGQRPALLAPRVSHDNGIIVVVEEELLA